MNSGKTKTEEEFNDDAVKSIFTMIGLLGKIFYLNSDNHFLNRKLRNNFKSNEEGSPTGTED